LIQVERDFDLLSVWSRIYILVHAWKNIVGR